MLTLIIESLKCKCLSVQILIYNYYDRLLLSVEHDMCHIFYSSIAFLIILCMMSFIKFNNDEQFKCNEGYSH